MAIEYLPKEKGLIIRQMRQAAGLTRREIAQEFCVTVAALKEYERGRRRMTPGFFDAAIKILGEYAAPIARPTAEPQPSNLNIGKLIKSAREACGLSRKKLADITGLSEGGIKHIEDNKVKGSKKTLVILRDALGLSFKIPLNIRKSGKRPKEQTARDVFIPACIQRNFTPGKTYSFARQDLEMRKKTLYYCGEQPGAFGVTHYLFRHPEAGYLESFTDAACVDWKITEVNHEKHRGKNAKGHKEGVCPL